MNILNLFSKRNILETVNKKNKLFRIIVYIICIILVAFSYNILFVKNTIVMTGMSGLAIVVKKLTGMNTGTFLLIVTAILIILSYFLLGIKKTKKNLVCAIVFPLTVSILEPITDKINIQFSSYLFTCLVACITYSIPIGIIYKVGYSTGGGDIINQIICKYAKTSVGQAGNYINTIIIFTASFVFGIPKTIYAIFTLIISNSIIDFIILGNSDSKFCIIKTKNTEYIEEFLKSEFNIGYSLLNSNGGTDKKKRKTIMCVVTSREYYRFKNLILDIDPRAFFITHDCYEVLGGTKKRLIN